MKIQFSAPHTWQLTDGKQTLWINPTGSTTEQDLVFWTTRPEEFPPAHKHFFYPGEYEAREVLIKAWALGTDPSSVVYRIKWNDEGYLILPNTKIEKVEENWADGAQVLLWSAPVEAPSVKNTIESISPRLALLGGMNTPEATLSPLGNAFELKRQELNDEKTLIYRLES